MEYLLVGLGLLAGGLFLYEISILSVRQNILELRRLEDREENLERQLILEDEIDLHDARIKKLENITVEMMGMFKSKAKIIKPMKVKRVKK